jgi:hypothetical protein
VLAAPSTGEYKPFARESAGVSIRLDESENGHQADDMRNGQLWRGSPERPRKYGEYIPTAVRDDVSDLLVEIVRALVLLRG